MASLPLKSLRQISAEALAVQRSVDHGTAMSAETQELFLQKIRARSNCNPRGAPTTSASTTSPFGSLLNGKTWTLPKPRLGFMDFWSMRATLKGFEKQIKEVSQVANSTVKADRQRTHMRSQEIDSLEQLVLKEMFRRGIDIEDLYALQMTRALPSLPLSCQVTVSSPDLQVHGGAAAAAVPEMMAASGMGVNADTVGEVVSAAAAPEVASLVPLDAAAAAAAIETEAPALAAMAANVSITEDANIAAIAAEPQAAAEAAAPEVVLPVPLEAEAVLMEEAVQAAVAVDEAVSDTVVAGEDMAEDDESAAAAAAAEVEEIDGMYEDAVSDDDEEFLVYQIE